MREHLGKDISLILFILTLLGSIIVLYMTGHRLAAILIITHTMIACLGIIAGIMLASYIILKCGWDGHDKPTRGTFDY